MRLESVDINENKLAILHRNFLREVDASKNQRELKTLTEKLPNTPGTGIDYFSCQHLHFVVAVKKIELAKSSGISIDSVKDLYQQIIPVLGHFSDEGLPEDFRAITLKAHLLLLVAKLEKILIQGGDKLAGKVLEPDRKVLISGLYDAVDQCFAVQLRINQLIQLSLSTKDTRILRVLHPPAQRASVQPDEPDVDLLAWELSFLDQEFTRLLSGLWEMALEENAKLQEYFIALLKRRCHSSEDPRILKILKNPEFKFLIAEKSSKKFTKNKKLSLYLEAYMGLKQRLDFCSIRQVASVLLEIKEPNKKRKKQANKPAAIPDLALEEKEYLGQLRELVLLRHDFNLFSSNLINAYPVKSEESAEVENEFTDQLMRTTYIFSASISLNLFRSKFDLPHLTYYEDAFAEFFTVLAQDEHAVFSTQEDFDLVLSLTLQKMLLDFLKMTRGVDPSEFRRTFGGILNMVSKHFPANSDSLTFFSILSNFLLDWMCLYLTGVELPQLHVINLQPFNGLKLKIIQFFLDYARIQSVISEGQLNAFCLNFQSLVKSLIEDKDSTFSTLAQLILQLFHLRYPALQASMKLISMGETHIAEFGKLKKAILERCKQEISSENVSTLAVLDVETQYRLIEASSRKPNQSKEAKDAVASKASVSQKASTSKKNPPLTDYNAWQLMLQNASNVLEKAKALAGLIRCYDKIRTNAYLKNIKKFARQLFHLAIFENPEKADLSEYLNSIISILDSHGIFRVPKDKSIRWSIRVNSPQALRVINYLKKLENADGFGKIYIYGGFVRDTLLGAVTEDVDICVDRDISDLLKCLQAGLVEMGATEFRRAGNEIYLVKVKFEDGSEIDVCSLREIRNYPIMLALYKKVTAFNFNINRIIYSVSDNELFDFTDALEIFTKKIFFFADEYNQRALCEKGETLSYFKQAACDRPETIFQALDILAKCKRSGLKMELGDSVVLLEKLETLKLQFPLREAPYSEAFDQPRKQVNNAFLKLFCRGYASATLKVFRELNFIPFITLFPQFTDLVKVALVEAHLETCCEAVDETYRCKPELKKADYDLRTVYLLCLFFSILSREKMDSQLCLFWTSFQTSKLVHLALEEKEAAEDKPNIFAKALQFFEDSHKARLDERAKSISQPKGRLLDQPATQSLTRGL